tara:strand:+ start:209 stop:472 length:264 start_codon:yes stop_codon:yes gene_type:complete
MSVTWIGALPTTTNIIAGTSGAADANYVHDQGSASATWVVTHGLGKLCSVTVVDTANTVVIGDITYNSVNQVTLKFSGSFSGKAYFN